MDPRNDPDSADPSDARGGSELSALIERIVVAYDGLSAEARRDPYDRGRTDELAVLGAALADQAADVAESDRRAAAAADEDERLRLAKRALEGSCDRLQSLVAVLRLASLVAPRLAADVREGLGPVADQLVAAAESAHADSVPRLQGLFDDGEQGRRRSLLDGELAECRELAAVLL